MTFSARTLGTSLTALTLASLLSWPAAAQTAAPAAAATAPHTAAASAQPHAKHRAHAEHLQQRHTQRLAQMKTLLQLQPQQEAAWQRYVQAITPQMPERAAPKPGARPHDAAKQQLGTLERLDRAKQLRQARHAAAEQRDQATRTFYASLNESQQKAFDSLQHRQGPRKGMHGKHPRHGHGHEGPHHGHPTKAAATR